MELEIRDNVAILRFDDGKANAVGHDFIDGMNEGLDKAEADAKAAVIVGRPGRFSGGFDLSEFQKGPDEAQALLRRGTEMFMRLYGHPQPLVAACTGHAIAAGAFLLLSSDTRIGTEGDFKIGLNETAIGMTLPVFGHELAANRLSKRHFTAAFIQANLYGPNEAVDAGFLDQVVAAEQLEETAIGIAAQLAELPGDAYAANKRDSRAVSLERIKASLG